MKKAPASTKTPGATDACAGCNEFASHGSGTQGHAARRVVSPVADDCMPRRLARISRIALELCGLFGSNAIPHYRSARAAHLLIDVLTEYVADDQGRFDHLELEELATECLNALIDGASSGFGEFDARLGIDGTVTFVGEPDAAWQVILKVDHPKNVRRRRRQPGLPRVLIEVRSTGKKFDCWSLGNAFRLLQSAKSDAINTFCLEAQARCDALRGGAA